MFRQSFEYRHFGTSAKGIFKAITDPCANLLRHVCQNAPSMLDTKGPEKLSRLLKIRRQHVFFVKGIDEIDGLYGIVAELEQVQVFRRDVAVPQHLFA